MMKSGQIDKEQKKKQGKDEHCEIEFQLYPNSNYYKGEFKGGVRHGKGVEISLDGVRYEGDF